jgi:hypothetical protein
MVGMVVLWRSGFHPVLLVFVYYRSSMPVFITMLLSVFTVLFIFEVSCAEKIECPSYWGFWVYRECFS